MKRTFALGLTSLALGSAALFAAIQVSKPAAEDYAAIDPTLLAGLNHLPNATVAEWVILHLLPLARRHKGAPPLPPPLPQPRDETIDGPDGQRLRLVLIDPAPQMKNKPVLLQIHGGGFIMGSPENNIPRLQRMAQRLGALIVAPDYRLAPDAPFPAALNDNYLALQWVMHKATPLGIDPKRIAVIGESGGGGLAALLALASRERGGAKLCAQLLIYPMLDDRTGTLALAHSAPGHGRFVWTPALNRKGWSSFLGVPPGSAQVPVGAVPARVAALEGLPPAFIGVGELDLFAAEDQQYAKRLKQAGVAVTFFAVSGAYHGFDQLNPDAESTRRFDDAWASVWQQACRAK